MIRLFLYDKFSDDATKEYEVELKEDIQISITKQFTDLSNPTAIINDWSKTVAIPFTQKNNEIFGCIFRADRIVTSDAPVGQFDFDPTKKIPFRLINNENVLMTGYVKVLSVEQTSSVDGKYNITLNGELGKIFQELKNITFNRSEKDTKYYIDGSEYVFEEMNKELIKTCWTTDGQSTMTLMKRSNLDYKVTDIIGFAPNNAFCEDFDYKSLEHKTTTEEPNQFESIPQILNEHWAGIVNQDANSIIPNGLTPRGFGEFRSYLQTPYIYWNKLFQIFMEKAKKLTGYEAYLDPSWFNVGNPYWYNLVYCLDRLKKTFNTINNTYGMANYPATPIEYPGEHGTTTVTHNINYTPKSSAINETVNLWVPQQGFFNLQNTFCLFNDATTYIQCNFEFDIDRYNTFREADISKNNAFLLNYMLQDENSHSVDYLTFALCDEETTAQIPDDYIKIYGSTFTQTQTSEYETHITVTFNIPLAQFSKPLYSSIIGNIFKPVLECRWLNTNNMIEYKATGGETGAASDISVSFGGIWQIINNERFGSYMSFSLNDLWNKEFNLFQQILNYCKIFRIYITLDESTKRIIFIPFDKFFKNYEIIDWNEKIDYSKPWSLNPNIIDVKNILFNYEDTPNTELRRIYKENYNSNYGEQKVVTDYSFDNNTTKLFEKVTSSNVASISYLDWYDLYTWRRIRYISNKETYIDNFGKDNKEESVFGEFLFYDGLKNFELVEQHPYYIAPFVKIADDTLEQIRKKTYVYNLTGADTGPDATVTEISTYPLLVISIKQQETLTPHLITFGIPSLNYTAEAPIESSSQSIYMAFWQHYIGDVYNIKTKKVTCYVRLTADDYKNFKFNKFVTIQNQLYIVNKIFDFDINSSESTKVELLSINNLNNYTDAYFDLWSITPSTLSYSSNEFIGVTFHCTLYNYKGISDIDNEFEISFDTLKTNIPSSWTKNITITKLTDYSFDVAINISAPFVVQTPSDYRFQINVGHNNQTAVVTGTIQVIRDTDMAQEMTPYPIKNN